MGTESFVITISLVFVYLIQCSFTFIHILPRHPSVRFSTDDARYRNMNVNIALGVVGVVVSEMFQNWVKSVETNHLLESSRIDTLHPCSAIFVIPPPSFPPEVVIYISIFLFLTKVDT